MPKICQKSFYKNIKVVLCKKTAGKTTNYSRIERMLKICHLAKAIGHANTLCMPYSLCKMVSLAQKLKMPKTIPQEHQSCSLEKTARKNTNYSRNRPPCKGYSSCRGHSLCKMVSLGQNLKMRKTSQKASYKNIRVVLCKKPLKKTPAIYSVSGYSLWKMVSLG